MESIDTQTPSGRMFLKIIGIFAEFERENIVERVKTGIERKIKEGYSIGGQPSYGYDRPKHQKIQVINEQEAAIVREVFDLFVNQSIPINDIARRLNVRQIPTKQGSTWGNRSIRDMLSNCNYIGNVRHHVKDEKRGYSVEGRHEPIIEREVFDTVQKILTNNKKVTPRKKPREGNYFSGFLICGGCNSKLSTHNIYKTLKDGTERVTGSYTCRNKTVAACTATSSVSHKKVERAFEEYITQFGGLDVADKIEIEEQKKRENAAQIKAYQEKQRQLETKEREAMEFYVNNKIELESYREIKKLLDKEKSAITAELGRLQAEGNKSELDKTDIINDIRENWSRLTAGERRRFLLQFMEKITLVSEKAQDGHYNNVKILGVDVLPPHEKQHTKQPKKYVRVR